MVSRLVPRRETCIDGTYADFSLEAMYPVDSPIAKTKIFSEVRRVLTEKGLADRAGVYFTNSCAWVAGARKYAFEKARGCETVSKGGNLLLNVGPTARGTFDGRAMSRFNDIGARMEFNDRSIYGCTQAPDGFNAPPGTALTWNPKTRTLYLHLYDYPLEFVPLEFWERIELAQFLHDASEIPIVPARKPSPGDTDLTSRNLGGLKLPSLKPEVEIPVVEIFLKWGVGMSGTKPRSPTSS